MEKMYKFRIYPNEYQKELIQKTFNCTNFVYNYFLNRKNVYYKETKEILSFSQCSRELTDLKNKYLWLKEPDKASLQNCLKDLDRAFDNYYKIKSKKKKWAYQKYKSKKNNKKSYRTNCVYRKSSVPNIEFNGNKIKLPKLGFVKCKGYEEIEGRILNATITQAKDEKYYCSLCCTDIVVEPLQKTDKYIGIDLGITDFAILSNGEKIINPRFFEKIEKEISSLQRKLDRQEKGSNNWEKTRQKLAKKYKYVTNQRNDFLQKITTELVKEYDIICIEDLDVAKLKSSKNNVRNKHIEDVSWGLFRQILEYKCLWYGKKLSVINKYYPSSQICNVCGFNSGKKNLSIRNWTCPNCGTNLDRDINAAINILNEGLRIVDMK